MGICLHAVGNKTSIPLPYELPAVQDVLPQKGRIPPAMFVLNGRISYMFAENGLCSPMREYMNSNLWSWTYSSYFNFIPKSPK
jgi:hypothetical protein